jgi:hypothetical protein
METPRPCGEFRFSGTGIGFVLRQRKRILLGSRYTSPLVRSLCDGSCAIRYKAGGRGLRSGLSNRGAWPEANGETTMKLDVKFPEWEPQYKAALLEVDQARLLERVAAAEAAIRQRMRAIFGRTDGDTERQAIGKALSALSVLKETLFS